MKWKRKWEEKWLRIVVPGWIFPRRRCNSVTTRINRGGRGGGRKGSNVGSRIVLVHRAEFATRRGLNCKLAGNRYCLGYLPTSDCEDRTTVRWGMLGKTHRTDWQNRPPFEKVDYACRHLLGKNLCIVVRLNLICQKFQRARQLWELKHSIERTLAWIHSFIRADSFNVWTKACFSNFGYLNCSLHDKM